MILRDRIGGVIVPVELGAELGAVGKERRRRVTAMLGARSKVLLPGVTPFIAWVC
jgi:hypothetical protein